MKKIYFLLFLFHCAGLLYSQNFFPVKAGDTLLYLRETYDVFYWDSYFKKIVTEKKFDTSLSSPAYVNVFGSWFRYDQKNQKLYTHSNYDTMEYFSADFNAWDTTYTATIMDVTRNFTSGPRNDSLYYASSDSIPYFQAFLSHEFRFKKDIGFIYDYNRVETQGSTRFLTFHLIEARGSNYSLSIPPPRIIFYTPIPSRLSANNSYPLRIYYGVEASYDKLIDSVMAFTQVIRADTLVKKKFLNGNKSSFDIYYTQQEIRAGDVLRVKFFISDSSLSRHKVYYPDTGYYEIKIDPPTNIEKENVPAFALNQNYPNPFNPSTKISYTIEKAGYVNITIYDMLGRETAKLVNGFKDAGIHEITFSPEGLPSGNYIYNLVVTYPDGTKSARIVKKMTLIK